MAKILALLALLPAALAFFDNPVHITSDGSVAPEMVPGVSNQPGRKVVKIRYGPFEIPSALETDPISREKGTLYNRPVFNVKKPCTDCIVTMFVPGLEYPNGTNADTDSGLVSCKTEC
jgi:hypothetical protein